MKRLAAVIGCLFLLWRAATVPSIASEGWDNPFCGASIAVLPWSETGNAPATRLSSTRYLIELTANGKQNVAGAVTFITAEDAYSVPIPRQPLLREAGTDTFYAEPVMVAFDKPIDVHYAFVDSIGVDGNEPAACPSVVQSVEPYDPARWSGVPSVGSDVVSTKPKYLQALPAIRCGKAYTPPDAPRDGSGALAGSGYGNKRLSTELHIYIDSNGIPLQVAVEKSSGVEGWDLVAEGAAQHTRYTPATFLCTPVVSEFRMTLDYVP